MPYIFRTVKQAPYIPPPHKCAPEYMEETHKGRTVKFANEYIIDLFEDVPNMSNYIASQLVLAEFELIKAEFLYVTVFKVEEGEKIDFETPCTVYMRNPGGDNGNSYYYPLDRYELVVADELKHLPLKYYTNSCGYGYSLDPEMGSTWVTGDMFMGAQYEWEAETGNGQRQLYLNAVHQLDWYKGKKNRISRQVPAPSLDSREKRFKERMKLIGPFISEYRIGADGRLKKGTRHTGKINFVSISDNKALRRSEIAKKMNEYGYRNMLTSWMKNYKAVYKIAELASCQHSHMYMLFDFRYDYCNYAIEAMASILRDFRLVFGGQLDSPINPNLLVDIGYVYRAALPGLDYSSSDVQGIISRMNEFYLNTLLLSNHLKEVSYPERYQEVITHYFPPPVVYKTLLTSSLVWPSGQEPYFYPDWRKFLDEHGEDVLSAIEDYFPMYENISRFINLLGLCEKVIKPKSGEKVIISDIELPQSIFNTAPWKWLKEHVKYNYGGEPLEQHRDGLILSINLVFQHYQGFNGTGTFMPFDYNREGWNMSLPSANDRVKTVRTGVRDLYPARPCGSRVTVEIPLIQGGTKTVTIDEKKGFVNRAILRLYRQYVCNENPDLIAGGNWASEIEHKAVNALSK